MSEFTANIVAKTDDSVTLTFTSQANGFASLAGATLFEYSHTSTAQYRKRGIFPTLQPVSQHRSGRDSQSRQRPLHSPFLESSRGQMRQPTITLSVSTLLVFVSYAFPQAPSRTTVP